MDKLVSIIVPCYNMEKYIERFLISILNQTYKSIELILVNDESTDSTENIIKEYKYIMEQNGIKVIYIYQKNRGLPGCINTGLKVFSGEYLTWSDPDDFLSKTSIEEKVRYLEENKEYGFVRSDCNIYYENDYENIMGKISSSSKTEIFNDLILERNMPLTSGNYMVRTESFLKVNPNKEIYDNVRGQNWQLLLPLAYKYRCGYIEKPLNNYLVRNGSMSHNDKSIKDLIYRCDEHQDILLNTINKIDMTREEREKYLNIIKEKYIRKKMYIGVVCRNKGLINTNYKLLKKEYNITYKDKIMFLQGQNLIFNIIIRYLKKVKGVMVR